MAHLYNESGKYIGKGSSHEQKTTESKKKEVAKKMKAEKDASFLKGYAHTSRGNEKMAQLWNNLPKKFKPRMKKIALYKDIANYEYDLGKKLMDKGK